MASSRRQVLLIRNPRARRAPAERVLTAAVRPLQASGWDVELRATSAPGEATELAAHAARAGADLVVACGGDGTVNEVANGLAGTATALAVAPAGTADVWAREVGIRRDPTAALAALPRMREARVDLGTVNGRYFLLMCGVGLDADVVRSMDGHPRAKRWLGAAAYAAVGVRAAVAARPVPCELTIDGETLRRDLVLAVAGNTRLYGGVLRLAAAALADDGLLDFVTFHGDGLARRAALALQAARGGLDRREVAGVDYLRAASIEVMPERPMRVQADGEIVGETPIRLGVARRALGVLVAPGASALFGPSDAAG